MGWGGLAGWRSYQCYHSQLFQFYTFWPRFVTAATRRLKNLSRMGQVIHSDVSGKVTAPRGGEIEEMEKEERRESGGGARGGGSGAGGGGGGGAGQRLKTYGCG